MRDKEWLKEKLYTEKYYRETNELKTKTTYGELYDQGVRDGINAALELIDQLDEPQKAVIPDFMAYWIEEFYLQGSNPLKVYNELDNDFVNGWTTEEDAEVYHWIRKNSDDFIDSLRNGYCVEVTQ